MNKTVREKSIYFGRRKRSYIYSIIISTVLLILVIISKSDLVTSKRTSSNAVAAAVYNADDDAVAGETAVKTKDNAKRICIDPGHGYDDFGASSEYMGKSSEKKINLKTSLFLRDKLIEMGYDVIMTRDSDKPPDSVEVNESGQYLLGIRERINFANSSDIDLYISLHCDSYMKNPSASGIRLYYLEDKSESQKYADELKAGINNVLEENADIHAMKKEDAYTVLCNITVPSVLVEQGFMTNKSDAVKLLNDEWLNKMAESLAEGIDDYLS